MEVFEQKLAIVREVYGFGPDPWEAMTTPRTEAFWRLLEPEDAGRSGAWAASGAILSGAARGE